MSSANLWIPEATNAESAACGLRDFFTYWNRSLAANRIDKMPPTLALILWLVLLLALLLFDPAKDPGTSWALWVPVTWMFILGSRLPSQWLGSSSIQSSAQALEEGNSLDRVVLSFLMLLAIGTLVLRRFNWGRFFRSNVALFAFVLFGLVSVFWSDFALISLKRWFRDLGNYLTILVVLSDPRPLEAVRALLRRLCYLLIPLSILVIKYFPQIGKEYEFWSGASLFVGAATSKNMLGAACLVSGIFFFWDTVTRWRDRKERRTRRIIRLNFAFIAMTFWLLHLARSATSTVCLVLGCVILIAAHRKVSQRRPTFLKALIPAFFCLYLLLAFGCDMNGNLAAAVGRDPTLTDRTSIWTTVLSLRTNPLLGTGYESFWIGPRLQYVWSKVGSINEAHNGYLEMYLNLGLTGLALLCVFLLSSYRKICRRLSLSSSLASLSLALFAVMLFYNITEAAFRSSLIWVAFLLFAIEVHEPAEDPGGELAKRTNVDTVEPFPQSSFEMMRHR